MKILQKLIFIFIPNEKKTKFYLFKYKEIKENIDNNIYNKDKDTIKKSNTWKLKCHILILN